MLEYLIFNNISFNLMSKSQIGDDVTVQGQVQQRQKLIRKIDYFKQKLADYEQIQREINQISMIVNEPKTSRISTHRQQTKSKVSDQDQKQNHNPRRNTNKKIKMYDLRKKLDKYMAQLYEKKVVFFQSQEYRSKLQAEVQRLTHEIEEQKKKAQSLVQLENRILNDLYIQEKKVVAEINQLDESVKKKEMFNFEKRKIRDQLRKIRYGITKLTKIRKGSSEFQLSITQSRGYLNDQAQRQILSENSSIMNDTAMWIGREKQRIEDFQSKVQVNRQKNWEMIDLFYNLKKKFSDNEVLIKHHKITIKLQTGQLNKYKSMIQEAKARVQTNNKKNEMVGNQLKQVEGERGYLRGKIGVIIQQQRLVKSINILAENDLQNLRQKLSYLRNIKQLINSQK